MSISKVVQSLDSINKDLGTILSSHKSKIEKETLSQLESILSRYNDVKHALDQISIPSSPPASSEISLAVTPSTIDGILDEIETESKVDSSKNKHNDHVNQSDTLIESLSKSTLEFINSGVC